MNRASLITLLVITSTITYAQQNVVQDNPYQRDLKSNIPIVHLSVATPTGVLISQIYGGAGCTTLGCSTYKNDYIELVNLSASAISLNGWSVQYASATGNSWSKTNLPNFTLQPFQYFLIAEAFNTNGVNELPTPDITGAIAMSATTGKVALVSATFTLAAACPTSPAIMDFVGYGTSANCHEGSGNAPAPSTTTAIFREGNGAIDNNDNATDFSAGTPAPRNSSSPLLPVEVSSFTANVSHGIHVVLEWTTISEVNNYGFYVERRAEHEPTFTELPNSFVAGAGTTLEEQYYSWTDKNVIEGVYFYRLKQVDLNGDFTYSYEIQVEVSGTLDVSVKEHLKNEFALAQNYPNPFNPRTTISFVIGHSSFVTLKVYNMLGEEVAILRMNEEMKPGSYKVTWDASDMPSGVYYYRLTAGNLVETKKLVLLR
jgi:hypothetical protein